MWAVLRIARRVFGQWVRAQFILGIAVGVFTFIGLILLSRIVDPVFGRYAVLLSVIAGILELVPIIGPIISAIPAVLIAATAGLEPVIGALVLYTLVQQLENNLLVPKIQGDAVQLHPAVVISAIIIGGSLAGLLGAILALPVTAAGRDVVRYLFRRLSPEAPRGARRLGRGLGLERTRASRRRPRRSARAMDPRRERAGPIQDPAGRSGGRGRGHRGRVPAARSQIPPRHRDGRRGDRPDGGDQRRVGGARDPEATRGVRPASARSRPAMARRGDGGGGTDRDRSPGRLRPSARRGHGPSGPGAACPGARDRVARLVERPLVGRAAATTRRCAPRTAPAPRASRRATPRGAS